MLHENNNSDCRFAKSLIGYIYGEIDGADKLEFEKHLSRCAGCTNELADFGIVRASVADWRDKFFAPLETPVIDIPEPVRDAARIPTAQPEKTNGFAALREFFALSFAWKTATAAAALIVCAGLFYVTVSSLRDTAMTISEVNSKASETPTQEVVVSPTGAQIEESASKQMEDKELKPPSPVKLSAEKTVKKSEVAAPRAPVAAPKTVAKTSTPAKTSARTKRAAVREEYVEAYVADDEEDSLRLADLFDEVDGR